MFSVGEFSKLAQVSKRQLRFYDGIGLFVPQVVQENGRRLYSASQLAELNRILALQQLGFSLEQIGKLVQDNISLEELRGMLKLKQAESEQRLETEQQRYRAIASRLKQIETASQEPLNVVMKSVPAQKVVSLKLTASLEQGTQLFRHMVEQFVEEKGVRYGPFFIYLFENEYDPERLEGEIGRVIESGQHSAKQDLELEFGELSAETQMATYVIEGASFDMHLAYGVIGQWVEANGYTLTCGSREMMLQLPNGVNGTSAVVEVQVPVQKV